MKGSFDRILGPSETERISSGLARIEAKIDSIAQLNASEIDRKLDNHFHQIESLLALYHSLPNLKLLPATRGWAGSPDFLLKISEVIRREKPAFVLEASSGVSTLIIGLALKLNGCGKVVSLDHDSLYASATKKIVEENLVGDVVDVRFCPLKPYDWSETDFRWYDIAGIDVLQKIDLLVIDGPPRYTQPLARYPAIPLLHDRFAERTIILLDDANRNDERVAVQKWIYFLERNNFRARIEHFENFEKGIAILEAVRL